MYMNGTDIIPFGKYKGQPVEVLAQDKQYLDWLMQQDWFNSRYQSIKTLIINNFREPSETPEHNKMQAMFTEDSFCSRFIDHLISKRVVAKIPESFTITSNGVRSLCKVNDGDVVSIGGTKCSYEVNGIDVVLDFNYHVNGKYFDGATVLIELKPSLSDDYPAVLRQMMVNKSTILLAGSYTGTGATLDQVRKIFKASNRTIVLLTDIPVQPGIDL
jgi:hypothetical protein